MNLTVSELHTGFYVTALFRMDVLLILINGIYILPNNFNYFIYLEFLMNLNAASFISLAKINLTLLNFFVILDYV